MTEPEIIVQMRGSIEILKKKLHEEAGAWIIADFLAAAVEPDHWMREIATSERLSDPFMPKTEEKEA